LANITPWMNIKGILENKRYETIFQTIRSTSEPPYFRHYAITSDMEVLNESPRPDTPIKLKKKRSGLFSYFSNYFS